MKYKQQMCLFLFVLFGLSAPLPHTSWKHYKNKRWGFCIAYPRGWDHQEGVNKAGLLIRSPENGPSEVPSEISVGALYAARSENRKHPLPLEEDLAKADQDSVATGGGTELTVLDQHNTVVGDHPALFRKISYKKLAGAVWVEETVAFQTKQDVDYFFELKTQPSELPKLEPIFNDIVKTFKIDCH